MDPQCGPASWNVYGRKIETVRSVCTCARACACVRACVRARVHACVHACMHACTCACMRACMRARVRVCVCACMRACVRACVRHVGFVMYLNIEPPKNHAPGHGKPFPKHPYWTMAPCISVSTHCTHARTHARTDAC